jgi:membrane fusion protein (multidrug efflux system)
VVLPLVAAVAGLVLYLNGGRYVTTDDAYVGAQKVLITDISGKIDRSFGKVAGQGRRRLFEIDPVPFRLVVAHAKARSNRRAQLRQSRRQHQDLRPDA